MEYHPPKSSDELLLTLDENGEVASEVLGFKKHKIENDADKTVINLPGS